MNLIPIEAQNIQYKEYSDENIINSELYKKGNVYQKDLLLFVDLLKKTHPIFESDLCTAIDIDSVKNNGYLWSENCNSIEQFKNYLQSIAVLLNDGHTSVFPSINMNAVYPFSLFIDENDIYLYVVDKKYDHYLGSKVTKINQVPVFDVINSFKNLISSDNETYFLEKVSGFIQFYDSWKYNPYSMPDSSLIFSFADKDDIILHPVSSNNMMITPISVKNQEELVTKRNRQPFSYVILPDKSICYLQFNQCLDQSDLRYKYEVSGTQLSNEELEKLLSQVPRFDSFVKNMMQEIKDQQIRTLVVDVRHNAGGNSKLCDILLSWLFPINDLQSISSKIRISSLWEVHYPLLSSEFRAQFAKLDKPFIIGKLYNGFEFSDEDNSSILSKMDDYFIVNKDSNEIFKGNVIFIQSPKTFSSAGMLITTAVDNKIGIVIGGESSYKPCSYGDLLGWELPNTNVQGFVSHKIFNRPDEKKCNEISIIPKIHIKAKFLDLVNGIDRCWDWILEYYND